MANTRPASAFTCPWIPSLPPGTFRAVQVPAALECVRPGRWGGNSSQTRPGRCGGNGIQTRTPWAPLGISLTLRPWAVPDGAIVLPRTRSAERLGSAPAQGLGAASADGQHVSGRKMQTHSCASLRSCHLPPHGPRSQQGNRTGPHNCDTPVTVEHFKGKSCWPQGAGNSKERERSGPTCDNVDNCCGALF